MTLDSFIEVADCLTKENQFTKEQWEKIIDCAFTMDKDFNHTVECFYVDLLGFDYEDCEDLVTDIQSGDGDAFERFIDDIFYYFENN